MGESTSGRVGGTARTDARWMVLGPAAGLAVAIILWGGYSRHWPWTGINGGTATLWDWLHLLLLSLAFAVLPVWFRSDTRVGARTKSRGVTVLAAFTVLVILGYTIPWAWTGFTGNTVWDWLNLLFLPLLLPLVVFPALTPKLMGEVVYLDADGNPIKRDDVEETAAEGAAAETAPLEAPRSRNRRVSVAAPASWPVRRPCVRRHRIAPENRDQVLRRRS